MWKITQIIEKKISIKSLYFAEEGPGHGSEDMKKKCNVNCFISSFLAGFHRKGVAWLLCPFLL